MKMILNVTELHVDTAYNDIETFFSEELRTDNTRRAYRNDIESFFKYMRNKNIQQLEKNDLWFEYKDILRYRSYLKSVYEKSSTVERKIASVSKLYKFFAKNNYNVNHHAFELEWDDEDDTESSGNLSIQEAECFVQLAKEMTNGIEKSLVIEIAYKTSIRISAILDLTTDKFRSVGNGLWEIKTRDKGKKNKKPITEDMYNRIMSVKKEGTDKIFNVSYTTMYDTIKVLSKKIGIPEERKISPHSLKKVLINWTLKETKDPVLAAWQGNHGVEVMDKHYKEEFVDYSNSPLMMLEKGNDITPLTELSKDELLGLIKKASYSTQNELLSLLKQGK